MLTLQPGARFAAQLSSSSDRSVCTLSDLEPNGRRAGGATIYIGGIGRTLDHEATIVHDVTRVVPSRTTGANDERFAALYETPDGETLLLEVANDTVDITLLRVVPRGVRRVVAATDRWYVGSDAEVHALTNRTAPEPDERARELIAVDAIDLAVAKAAPSADAEALLCVVDTRGLTWFDHDNQVVHRRALTSPTAIAGDALAGGWLVAADGDILQLADPMAEPVVLARGVGLASRVRRDVDTVYATLESGELVAVGGIRHGSSSSPPRTIAAFARGFTQFDASFVLFVDDGAGPQRFDA